MNFVTINALHEWSWIFGLYSGFAYGEHLDGNKVSIISHPNASPFFYFADTISNYSINQWFKCGIEDIYNKDFDPKSINEKWTPPPYQKYYSQFFSPNDDKKVIVISNKYNKEWFSKVYNYLSLEFLEEFFKLFSNKYKIYYIRYNGNSKDKNQEYFDDVTPLPFDDYKLTQKYNIETIYDIMNEYEIGFNTAQLYIHSAAKYTVTVAGGNSILSSFFGDEMIQFNCSNCTSSDREIWGSDTWIKRLNNVKIIGEQNYNNILNIAKERWL